MSSDVVSVERLDPADVAGALALSDAAGWNQGADDWSFFIAAGITLGVRDERATLIATAAALPYDAETGWISMVLVDAANRHRGIAGRLVDLCVAALRERGCTPVLDATPAGAAVYARTGFAAGFAFERWEGDGTAGASDAARSDDAHAAATVVASAAHAAELIDLDRRAGGVDRTLLWRSFLTRPDTRAWRDDGGDGFALRRAGRRATQVGPLVAAHDDAALDLLAAALAGVAGRIFIDVPVHCLALARELARRGFTRQRSFVRMALGNAPAAAARERVFALAGPEFG